MLKEFKGFIMKGNVMDLAVAVIMGGAFSAIISSLVDDIITPLLLAPAMAAAGVSDIGALAIGRVGERGGALAVADGGLRREAEEGIARADGAIQPVVFVARLGEADVAVRAGHVVRLTELADDFQIVIRVVIAGGDVAHRVGDFGQAVDAHIRSADAGVAFGQWTSPH